MRTKLSFDGQLTGPSSGPGFLRAENPDDIKAISWPLSSGGKADEPRVVPQISPSAESRGHPLARSHGRLILLEGHSGLTRGSWDSGIN